MKYFLTILILFMSLCTNAFAQNSTNSEELKIELINKMTNDGFLSPKLALEAKEKYIDVTKLNAKSVAKKNIIENKTASKWTDYLSLINFIKVCAVILLLYTFSGVLTKTIKAFWHLIVQVPTYIYQLAFLGASITATIAPQLISTSQSFYIALFGAFANIILLGWIFSTYPKLEIMLMKIFNLGIPLACILSFFGMIYFSALALTYQSEIFGFFAAVCLSGIFSFGLYYSRGTLWLHFKDSALSSVVFGHLIVLGIYAFIHTNGMFADQLVLFSTGLEYYCTIALCTGLLVGSAPWYKENTTGLYTLLFVLVFVASILGYFFLDLKVIGGIVSCFFVLFCLEWISYLSFRAGALIGAGVLGSSLFGLAMLLEKFGSSIILHLGL